MRALAAAALCASAALAQGVPGALDNPRELDDRKEYAAEGVSFEPVEGSVVVALDGADGQRVISATRAVKLDGRDERVSVQVEVIGDLDLATYRRIVEGLQGARGLAVTTVDEATRDGRRAWRADLAGARGDPATHLVAIDAGDRIVVAAWAPRDAVAAAFGPLIEESVRSLRVVPRQPDPAADDPAEEWAPGKSGVTLKVPRGWKRTERGEACALRNPRDRFENLAFGLLDGTAAQKAAEWERLRKDREGAKSCLEGREETWSGRASFVCRSRLVHQGIPVVSETRLVEHRGRLVFVSLTAREDRFDDRRAVLDAVLATLALEP